MSPHEIGVVLLLLLLGLEYTAPELVTGLRRSWAAGLFDIVANATPAWWWRCCWAGVWSAR